MSPEGGAAVQPGLRLGAWALQGRIGQGGRGEVWRAVRADGLYDAQAAIKLLYGDGAHAAVARRFVRERAALGRLTHTGIAALLDAGVQPPHAYLVLELVEGQSLAVHVREHAPCVADRVALLMQVAQAVEYAHARLVVHRDLKPANVRVTPAGATKLLDFGLAASPGEDAHGLAGFTPAYAAPELIADDAASTAVDVFALGAMLFELLTGALPFGQRGDARAAMEHAVLHQPPHRIATLLKAAPDDSPDSPGRPRDARRALGDLEAIAAKALNKVPTERYVGVHALIEDLQRWQARRPVAARRDDSWRHRAALLLRRHALLSGVGALLLLALTAGLVASTWQRHEADRARQRSERVTAFLAGLLTDDHQPHGDHVPNVLELLDASRHKVDAQFADDPATRLRLLEVLSRTYMALNRFDHALPLGEQWLALAREQPGARESDAAVLQARLSLGQVQQIIGNHDAAIALLEPIAPALAHRFGPDSEEVRQQQFILAADYMHSLRLADSEAALERVRVLTERLHPNDAFERADYLQNLSVLRQRQGRLAEALAVTRQTRPMWNSTDPRLALQVLVLRRAEIVMMGENAEFAGIDELAAPLLADIRRALGPGNDLALQTLSSLANVQQLQGRTADELRTRQSLVDGARADGLDDAALLVYRSELLMAQARQGQPVRAALRAMLAEAAAVTAAPRRSRVLLTLAEAALAIGDTPLAAQAMTRLREQPLPAALESPGSRLAKVAGRVARAQGDLERSATLLQQRLARVLDPRDVGAVQVWGAYLDVALTAVLQGAPDAAERLSQAAAARPAALPEGHPLDLVTRWLHARLAAGRDDAPDVRTAWAALTAARGAPPALGNLGGWLP